MYNPLEEDRLLRMKLIVEQIVEDAGKGDYTAIEELLCHVPEQSQVGFLNEARQEQYARATSLS